MEESLYQAENNTKVIEKKLESILNDAEEQRGFNSQNFLSLETMIFIWIIGSETSSKNAELLFKKEIKKIVSDTRTVQVISDWEKTTGEEVYSAFSKRINQASQDYLDVRFDRILICPIFLTDCLCGEEDERRKPGNCSSTYFCISVCFLYDEWNFLIFLTDFHVNGSGIRTSDRGDRNYHLYHDQKCSDLCSDRSCRRSCPCDRIRCKIKYFPGWYPEGTERI